MRKCLKGKAKKGAIELDVLGWILIGVAVLVIMVIGYLIMRSQGGSAINFIKNLFGFGKHV